jgi:hypothetical protein
MFNDDNIQILTLEKMISTTLPHIIVHLALQKQIKDKILG